MYILKIVKFRVVDYSDLNIHNFIHQTSPEKVIYMYNNVMKKDVLNVGHSLKDFLKVKKTILTSIIFRYFEMLFSVKLDLRN